MGQLGSQRAEARRAADKAPGRPGRPVPEAPGLAPKQGLGALKAVGIPDKVAAQHGPSFEAALQPLGALARAGSQLEGWQAKAFGRSLEQLYKTIGQHLAQLPEANRPAAAKATLEAMQRLIERARAPELLVPALSSAAGVLDEGTRALGKQRLKATPAEAARLGVGAAEAITALLEAMVGRAGQGTALNVYPQLVEQIGITLPAHGPADRDALLGTVRDLLLEGTPRRGIELTGAARVAELVAKASRAQPGKVEAIAAAVREAVLEPLRDHHAQTQALVAEAPALPTPALQAGHGALSQGLQAVLAANPQGPEELFGQIEQLQALLRSLAPTAVRMPATPEIWAQLGPVLERSAESPAIGELLGFLRTHLKALPSRAEAPKLLAALAAAPDERAFGRRLLDLVVAVRGAKLPAGEQVEEILKAFEALPSTSAVQVALAFAGVVPTNQEDHKLLSILTRQAARTRPDDPAKALQSLAAGYARFAGQLAPYPQLRDVRKGLLEALALASPQIEQPNQQGLMQALGRARATLPLFDPSALLRGGEGRPPILEMTDRKVAFATRPADFMASLLNAAKAPAANDAELSAYLAPLAVRLAVDAGHIQNGAKLQLPRILEDWTTAVAQPAKLRHAARAQQGGALKAREQPSVRGFLEAHPELPLDLAFTAGLHLSPEQLAWVVEEVRTTRGRDTVRALRDFVFAAVQAQRLDLVEAARTSESPPKAKSAILREVAQSFRTGQVAEIPFDAIVAGLAAGGDPMADILAAKAKAAFAGLDLAELAEGKVEAAGLDEITRISKNVAELLTQYKKGFVSMDKQIDMGRLREPLLGAMKSVLQGTWPAPKYEDENGRRQMAILTPAQQEAWRRTTVTPAQVADAGGAPQRLEESLALVRGLAKAVPEAVRLEGGDLPRTWDVASVQALRQLRDDGVAALRAAEKGSKEHRALGARLGDINARLALIELVVEAERVLPDPQVDGRSALRGLAPLLTAAVGPLRKAGARGAAEAADEAAAFARTLQGSPRTGRHAADEDGFAQLVDSHKSGCLSPGSKLRRWGICGSLVDANTRMLRVLEGEKQLYRTFMRVLQAELPGYRGPVLWVENPIADGGGQASDLQLLYAGLYQKAAEMGVPVLHQRGAGQLPPGWKTKQAQVTLTIDGGHTGLMHSDALGQQTHQQNAGKTWNLQKTLTVVSPPGVIAA